MSGRIGANFQGKDQHEHRKSDCGARDPEVRMPDLQETNHRARLPLPVHSADNGVPMRVSGQGSEAWR